MESFAARYHQENPDVFSCSDTAWVLAFGLMILNTDMYNRNIRVRDGCGCGWWSWVERPTADTQQFHLYRVLRSMFQLVYRFVRAVTYGIHT